MLIFFPLFAGARLIDKKSHALIVAGIEPEHAGEDVGRFVKALESPEA